MHRCILMSHLLARLLRIHALSSYPRGASTSAPTPPMTQSRAPRPITPTIVMPLPPAVADPVSARASSTSSLALAGPADASRATAAPAPHHGARSPTSCRSSSLQSACARIGRRLPLKLRASLRMPSSPYALPPICLYSIGVQIVKSLEQRQSPHLAPEYKRPIQPQTVILAITNARTSPASGRISRRAFRPIAALRTPTVANREQDHESLLRFLCTLGSTVSFPLKTFGVDHLRSPKKQHGPAPRL